MAKRPRNSNELQPALDPSILDFSEEEIAKLRADIWDQLKALKLPSWAGAAETSTLSKDGIRAIHASQRRDVLQRELTALGHKVQDLLPHFAEGKEVRPDAIDPELILVQSEGLTAD